MSRTRHHSHRWGKQHKNLRPGCWTHEAPGWWTRLFMNVPKRRRNKHVARGVLRGGDPDGTAYPLGNRKPHKYYW